jgi:hypothetical protein
MFAPVRRPTSSLLGMDYLVPHSETCVKLVPAMRNTERGRLVEMARRPPRIHVPEEIREGVRSRAAELGLQEYRSLGAAAGVSASTVGRFYKNETSADVAAKLMAAVRLEEPLPVTGINPELDDWASVGAKLLAQDKDRFQELLEALRVYTRREESWQDIQAGLRRRR